MLAQKKTNISILSNLFYFVAVCTLIFSAIFFLKSNAYAFDETSIIRNGYGYYRYGYKCQPPFGYYFGNYASTAAIAIDKINGAIYVANPYKHYVQKLSTNGRLLKQWGGYSNPDWKDGKFKSPLGIALDSVGNVYVIDYTRRIQKFSPDGEFLNKFELSFYPKQIDIDDNDDIYVLSGRYNGEIVKVTFKVADPKIYDSTSDDKFIVECATPGATIRYAFDYASITEDSPIYKGPVSYVGSITICAQAFKEGYEPSNIAIAGSSTADRIRTSADEGILSGVLK